MLNATGWNGMGLAAGCERRERHGLWLGFKKGGTMCNSGSESSQRAGAERGWRREALDGVGERIPAVYLYGGFHTANEGDDLSSSISVLETRVYRTSFMLP